LLPIAGVRRIFFWYNGIMPFAPDMMTKVKDLRRKGADLVKGLHLPRFDKKLKLLFAGLGAALLILIICLTAAVLGMNPTRNTSGNGVGVSSGAFQPGALPSPAISSQAIPSQVIPPEEMFLPEEPDFLPGILPEREQREFWTAGDAGAFWYNPLETGEEPWRDRIEAVVDELLERVP
jgi:hypothetical protein